MTKLVFKANYESYISTFTIDGNNIKTPSVVNKMINDKMINVSVGMVTKTAVNLTFQIGETTNVVNFESDKYKTLHKKVNSIWNERYDNCFKFLKNQNIYELLDYIQEVFNKVYSDLDLESIEAVIDFNYKVPYQKVDINEAIEKFNTNN